MSAVEPSPRSRIHFWANVLAGIILVVGGIYILVDLAMPHSTPPWPRNEHSVRITMRSVIRDAMTRFRLGDRDGNGIADPWTVDFSGLYRVTDRDGGPIALIDASLAGADASPAPEGGPAKLGPLLPKAPWKGYWFRAIRKKNVAHPPGIGNGKVEASTEKTEPFAIVAFPADYPDSGHRTFLIDEGGRLWSDDLGAGGGDKILEWPASTDDLAASGWEND